MSVEKVLNYSRGPVGDYDGVAQTRYWDCGPASAQIVLQAAGINKSEQWLIDRIGTTEAGTNHTGLITPVLNELLPGSDYKVVWLTKDPPTKAQVDQLFADVRKSIDGNRGCIFNFVSPPWNRPKPSYKSDTPLAYNGTNTIFHYLGGLGYAVDDAGGRHIWLADPGFRPFGMWCRVEDVARLIVPHSYAFASGARPAPVPPPPTPAPAVTMSWLQEFDAVMYSDPDAIGIVVRAAKNGDSRARRALTRIEQTNPAALQAFIEKVKA